MNSAQPVLQLFDIWYYKHCIHLTISCGSQWMFFYKACSVKPINAYKSTCQPACFIRSTSLNNWIKSIRVKSLNPVFSRYSVNQTNSYLLHPEPINLLWCETSTSRHINDIITVYRTEAVSIECGRKSIVIEYINVNWKQQLTVTARIQPWYVNSALQQKLSSDINSIYRHIGK